MANLDLLLKALDTAHWEMSEAFKDLPDEETWRRPHPRLLSIGELAAHVAYWEAVTFFGEGGLGSSLVVSSARYYTTNESEPFELPLGAAEVLKETQRVHSVCKKAFAAEPHDSADPNPHRDEWTWGFAIEYQVFHVSYHVGQMYSVRHLLGHQTPDN